MDNGSVALASSWAESNGDHWYAETDRIALRTFDQRDLDLMLEYRNDPEFAYLQGWETPFTEDQAHDFFAQLASIPAGTPGEWHQFAVVDKHTGETVGDVGLHVRTDNPEWANVGYTIARANHRKGYASEALGVLIEYAFTHLGITTIHANALAENWASRGVAERVGMTLRNEWTTDRGSELVEYAIDNPQVANE